MQNKIIAVTSPENPHLKQLKSLWDNRKRKKSGLFFAEGVKEIEMAVEGGYKVVEVFFAKGFDIRKTALNVPADIIFYELSENLAKGVMYREKTEGVTAVFEARSMIPDDIVLSENPMVIVLESVEKPGNLGAVIRTADACGADAVIVCDAKTDVFHPNVIRSSVGCLFSKQVAVASGDETLSWLRSKGLAVVTASVQAKKYHYDAALNRPVALVFGTEADGLSDFWNNNSDVAVKIPMMGKNDSLNVSVSVAVMCYEVLRNRIL
jgi:TrmH family RNA methyltransferase